MSAEADALIAHLDRAVRRKRRGQVVASVVLVVAGAGFCAVPELAMRVIGAALAALGVALYFVVRHSELSRAGRVRAFLRDDPDAIVWIWSAVRRPEHVDQTWFALHARDGTSYSALAPTADAPWWAAELRRRCPRARWTSGLPTRALQAEWRNDPNLRDRAARTPSSSSAGSSC